MGAQLSLPGIGATVAVVIARRTRAEQWLDRWWAQDGVASARRLEAMAAAKGISPGDLQRALDRLVERGALDVVRDGRATIYARRVGWVPPSAD